MEVLEFVFQSFWHWLGCLILITAPFAAFGNAVSRIVKPSVTINKK